MQDQLQPPSKNYSVKHYQRYFGRGSAMASFGLVTIDQERELHKTNSSMKQLN